MNTSLILCALALGAAGAASPSSPYFLHLKATTGPQPPVVLEDIRRGADLLPLPPGAYADWNLGQDRPLPAGITDQIDPLEVEALLSAASAVKHAAPPLVDESPLMAQRLLAADPWVGEDAPLPDMEFPEEADMHDIHGVARGVPALPHDIISQMHEHGNSDTLEGMTGDMETLKRWEANAPKSLAEDPTFNLPAQPVAPMRRAPSPRLSSLGQPPALPADGLMNWFQDMKANVEMGALPLPRLARAALTAPQQRPAREQPAIQSQPHPVQVESLAPAGHTLDRKYIFNMRTQQWELSSVRPVKTDALVSQRPVQQQPAPPTAAAATKAEPQPVVAPVVAAAPRPFVAAREPWAPQAKPTQAVRADQTPENLHKIKPTEKETDLLKSLLKAEGEITETTNQLTVKAAAAHDLPAKEVQEAATEHRFAEQSLHTAAPQQPVRKVQVQVPSIVELEHEMAATAAQVEKAEKAVGMSTSSEQAAQGVANVANTVGQLRSKWAAQEVQRHRRVVEAQRKFIAAQRYMSHSNALKRQKIQELMRSAAARKANIHALEAKVNALEEEKHAALARKTRIQALKAKVNTLKEERRVRLALKARVNALEEERRAGFALKAPKEDAASWAVSGSMDDLMRLGSVWEAKTTPVKGALAAPIMPAIAQGSLNFRIAEKAGGATVVPREVSHRQAQMADATATARFLDAHSPSRLQQMLPEEEAAAAEPATNDADATEMDSKLTEHFLNLGNLWDKVQSGADAA